MFKKLWNEKYSFELIATLTKNLWLGIVMLNFITPLAVVYILLDFISHTILFTWLFIHFIFFFIRILLNQKLIRLLEKKNQKVYVYLKVMYVASFLNTFLYGYIIWLSVLQNVPDTSIFILGVLISGLATGSISTLGSVFSAFLIYMVPSLLFLISALLYHGGDIYQIFALTIFAMMGVFSISGYQHYITMRNLNSLDSTFKTIYDNSSDGIVIFKESKFISLNKAMQKLFKYDSEDAFLNASLRRISPTYQPDGSSSVKKMVQMIKATFRDGVQSFEWVHKDRFGEEFWCEIVLTKINLNGVDLIYGVWRDISQRKELEFRTLQDKEKIQSLNKSLEQRVKKEVTLNREKDKQMLHQSRLAQMGEMISMIAHQWRQPLSAIASAGALINLHAQLNKLDKETAIEVSKNIATYTQHLSATIDDFRDFFKEDKDKEITNYTYLVKSVLNIIETTLESKNIRVIEELTCKSAFLSYPNELKQVIINLVKNAQDILLEKKIEEPYVKIKTYEEDGKYILEVSDNGGGIDAKVIDNIFDPYFSTKLEKDGTGLGLYMSKTIVEEHCNGKLSCYNTQDGACFKIELVDA